MKLRVGSRESRLAVVQSELVMAEMARAHPDIELELVTMRTTGDRILDRTLDKVGGKGLFVKELDAALREGRVDLAVDLPLAAFSRREDPRDALVLPLGARDLDRSRPIGCASARRRLQLQKLFPGTAIRPVRGNVLTRLQKLDSGEYGALVLAMSGLKRLGLEGRACRLFSTEELLPAAGQGILAVQRRQGLDPALFDCLRDREGALCALAERAFVRELEGGCSAPTAAHAVISGETIRITGLYADQTERLFRDSVSGPADRGEELARALAKTVKEAALCPAE